MLKRAVIFLGTATSLGIWWWMLLLMRETVNMDYARTIFILVLSIVFVVISWVMFPHVVEYLTGSDECNDSSWRVVQLIQLLLLTGR